MKMLKHPVVITICALQFFGGALIEVSDESADKVRTDSLYRERTDQSSSIKMF